MTRSRPPRKVTYFEPVPPRLARNTIIESTFEVDRAGGDPVKKQVFADCTDRVITAAVGGLRSFSRARPSGDDAPIPDLPSLATERGDSTRSRHSLDPI
jgi:hypothetical protein